MPVPVSTTADRSHPTRSPTRQLVALFAAQALFLGLVAAYVIVLHQPLNPGDGLRQLGLLSLRERVAGAEPLGGRPTLVVLGGPQQQRACRRQVETALRARAGADAGVKGLAPAYGLIVYVPGTSTVPGTSPLPSPLPGATEVRTDADGALARRLALPRAVGSCRPGYAIVDAQGFVRYRTYDPGWAEHAEEQEILFESAAAARGSRP